jgi:hypothetical protein
MAPEVKRSEAEMTPHKTGTEPARDRWEELPRWQQTGIIALGAVELILTAQATVDLIRRPGNRVRGPKTLWFLTFAVQPFGPLAYLSMGRRHP